MYYPFCSMNAPVMVELEGETDPLKIAMKELKLVTATLLINNACNLWPSMRKQGLCTQSTTIHIMIHISFAILDTEMCKLPIKSCINGIRFL